MFNNILHSFTLQTDFTSITQSPLAIQSNIQNYANDGHLLVCHG